MKNLLLISIILVFMNSCFMLVEDSLNLLENFKLNKVDSIYISIGSITYRENQSEPTFEDFIDTTIVISYFNQELGNEINGFLNSLSKKTLKEDKNKSTYSKEYFNQVSLWRNKYNVIPKRFYLSSETTLEYNLVFDLYFYSQNVDYNRLELMMDRNGLSYTFCCKDNDKFPYNTFKGLSKYNREWVFNDSVKVKFINMVNSLLKEVPSNNKLQFISK